MAIAKKGFADHQISTMTPILAKKAHNESTIISTSEHYEFKTNNSYKNQVIKFQGTCYKPKNGMED